MKRWDALGLIAETFADDPIVVTLGGTTREMAAMHRGANHLYVLDSMGLPPAIGLGLALGLEGSAHEKVVVIEGDGSLLMGLSTLATVGLTKPKKLTLIVLDNRVFAATGGQATASAAVDFCGVARACGMEAREVDGGLEELREALAWTRSTPGPLLLRVRIEAEQAKTPYVLEDPVLLGATFTEWLSRS